MRKRWIQNHSMAIRNTLTRVNEHRRVVRIDEMADEAANRLSNLTGRSRAHIASDAIKRYCAAEEQAWKDRDRNFFKANAKKANSEKADHA